MTPSTRRMPATAFAVRTLTVIAAFLWLANANPVQAQTWEYKYGSTTRLEDGKFRVIPVNGNCQNVCYTTNNNGYIAVGTSSPQMSTDPMNADVHVVRTDNNGNRIWEFTYDVTGHNDWDQGWSIIELSDGTGFMITGEVRYSSTGTSDAFLMKIDCNGFWQWSKTYGGPWNDGGRDLIQATTGNPGAGTNPSDIIVSGYSFGPTAAFGTMDAYLFRTQINGTPIWGQTYHYQPGPPPGQEDFFYSLTEATPMGGAVTGDIVAAGYTLVAGAPGTQDALVVRVNGDNGTIGPAPQGSAIYGVAGALDEFSSVIELQNPAEAVGGVQNVVLLGVYNGGTVYAVKLAGGDPVLPLVQQSIFGAAGEPMFGRTVREILFPIPAGASGVQQFDLITTGWIIQPGGASDMFLMSLLAPGLMPGGGGGGVFGVYGGRAGNEEGWSVYPVDATSGRSYGFILCGHTTQMWYFPPLPNAQQDMYLVKTDGFGSTGCQRPLPVLNTMISGSLSIPLVLTSHLTAVDQQTEECIHRWELNICPRPPGVPCTRPNGDGSDDVDFIPGGVPDYTNPALFPTPGRLENPSQSPVGGGGKLTPQGKVIEDASGLTTVYPNPVKVGDPIRITSPIKGEAALIVTNTAGETVVSQEKMSVDKDGTVTVKTNGWGAGAYLVTIRNGEMRSTIRVVVVE